ncbi:flagellar motor protein MotD [Pseudomaricurvus alkylphenolicus]|uniref:flagellar motor protein MotD n=1 Tax=Pseudomaricurvus alkylphenolicus TaxID=1306991 RepID=UPI00141D7BD7|nr:flagellar motor protein MotD [Pseudomaricurvus alkylphenolicus]NIB43182.1 flagellar motor protein MotD [Pseudomaricurvus alkylphenolicus]
MPRRRPVEVDTHHERWLVSYSDFITLLFAFFVVMYSISQVSESKYRVLSETLTEAFSQTLPKSPLSARDETQPGEPVASLDPLQIGSPSLSSQPSEISGDAGDGARPTEDSLSAGEGAFDKTADLPQLSDLFEDEFADLIDDELVQVHSNELWLEVELKSSILFATGNAQPTLQARSIFADVAALLRGYNNPVQIEGFTDNVPINNARYPSNWELSAARAASVVKLLASSGIQPQRLSAVGYGEYQPVEDNATAEGRAANRRVVLMIARDRPERPNVNSADQIAGAVDPPQREVTSPFPQPGLDTDAIAENPTAAAEPATAPETEVSEQDEGTQPANAGSTETASEPATDETGERTIRPVEKADGGLLFTSDPDLPRN